MNISIGIMGINFYRTGNGLEPELSPDWNQADLSPDRNQAELSPDRNQAELSPVSNQAELSLDWNQTERYNKNIPLFPWN